MNFLKKGPELKLSKLKVPDFLLDLYWDLKDRHLLPLAAVLAISIVVVPLALSHSGGSEASEEEAVATPSTAETSTLAVARSTPGLRDYRRRLRGARALDPFRPQAEAAEAAASAESGVPLVAESEASPSAEVVESPSAAVEAPVEAAPPASLPGESESGEPEVVTQTQTQYATQMLDVRIVTVSKQGEGAKASAKPRASVRRRLPELTMLPSRGTPVAIFMGPSADGKKALLLVSSDVQSMFGDGECVIGTQTCQLLALEAGVPETFVYGPQARTYRIEILKIDQTLTSKPRRASFGKPKGKGGERGGKEASEGSPPPAGRVSVAQPR